MYFPNNVTKYGLKTSSIFINTNWTVCEFIYYSFLLLELEFSPTLCNIEFPHHWAVHFLFSCAIERFLHTCVLLSVDSGKQVLRSSKSSFQCWTRFNYDWWKCRSIKTFLSNGPVSFCFLGFGCVFGCRNINAHTL